MDPSLKASFNSALNRYNNLLQPLALHLSQYTPRTHTTASRTKQAPVPSLKLPEWTNALHHLRVWAQREASSSRHTPRSYQHSDPYSMSPVSELLGPTFGSPSSATTSDYGFTAHVNSKMDLVLGVLEEALWKVDGVVRRAAEGKGAGKWGNGGWMRFRDPFAATASTKSKSKPKPKPKPKPKTKTKKTIKIKVTDETGSEEGEIVEKYDVVDVDVDEEEETDNDDRDRDEDEYGEEYGESELEARTKSKLRDNFEKIISCIENLEAYSALLDHWSGAEVGMIRILERVGHFEGREGWEKTERTEKKREGRERVEENRKEREERGFEDKKGGEEPMNIFKVEDMF